MIDAEIKKENHYGCTVCTGCGRCGKPAATPEVSMEYGLKGRKWIEKKEGYIVVADIGTTTVAMLLRRVSDGEIMDCFADVNPQRKYGFDVLSRIQAATEPKEALQMKQLMTELLEKGIRQFKDKMILMRKSEKEILLISIAANTTMTYLLMGHDPKELGRAPFHAGHLEEQTGELLGLPMIVLPAISAFVGGDIFAGVYAVGMENNEEISLLVDLGTNGEMVLGCRDKMIAASTAAGPAFEGVGEAGNWASDRVAITAFLLQNGILDETGLMADEYFDFGVVAEGILITQQDIRQMQMAKAAVCAGIFLLCREYGVKPGDIDRVYLAGGFGRYLSVEAAQRIGLLPCGLKDKTLAAGNTALEGAFLYARDRLASGYVKPEGKSVIKSINLALMPGFEEIYLDCMGLRVIEAALE